VGRRGTDDAGKRWARIILTSLSGLGFEEAWSSRISETTDDLRIPFIGRDSLIKNKRATGPRDRADVAALRDIVKRRQGVLPDIE
jgi:hypothetical protein